MKRIILDTRSNFFFRGIELDQNYDQRGGLCQVGEGHVVVTAKPVDPEYIAYWKETGFTIPHLISVSSGAFDPRYTLSELIIQNEPVQQEIKALSDSDARLEFCYIEETELRLAELLKIPAYCNFDVSIPLSRKIPFKKLCKTLSLNTPDSFYSKNQEELFDQGKKLITAWSSILIKANAGSGGICSGGMFKADNLQDFEIALLSALKTGEEFFLEKMIHNKQGEVAVHWEICEDGKLILIGIFDQISKNFGYDGVSYPSGIPESVISLIKYQLTEKLAPYLIQKGAKGFFCSDVIIDDQGVPYWIDFNPRKGAILYARDMVRRVSETHFNSADCYFWHEHVEIPINKTFSTVAQRISDLLDPKKKPFAVITNPGVIPFGYVDITGISVNSKQEANQFFKEAEKRLFKLFF